MCIAFLTFVRLPFVLFDDRPRTVNNLFDHSATTVERAYSHMATKFSRNYR